MKVLIESFLISLLMMILVVSSIQAGIYSAENEAFTLTVGESTTGIAVRLFDKAASLDWCDGDYRYSIGCALYYYNPGRNVPLYLHIDLRTDNEHCFALWWFASTI